MDLDQEVRFSDTVFAQQVDGEMVLLDMKSENYFGLDSVGTDIWQAIEKKKRLKEVLEILKEQYEADEDVLRRDLIAFVKQLQEQGLIEVIS